MPGSIQNWRSTSKLNTISGLRFINDLEVKVSIKVYNIKLTRVWKFYNARLADWTRSRRLRSIAGSAHAGRAHAEPTKGKFPKSWQVSIDFALCRTLNNRCLYSVCVTRGISSIWVRCDTIAISLKYCKLSSSSWATVILLPSQGFLLVVWTALAENFFQENWI